MFIVIDRERLCVLYKHENQTALVSLANLEVPEAAIVVMSAIDPDSYERFTDYELKELFKNICGEGYVGYNRPQLVKSVMLVVRLSPESDINPAEVEAQLASVGCTEQQFKYQRGSLVPSKQLELYAPKAVVSVAGYTPLPKRYHVPNEALRVHTQAAAGTGNNPHLAAGFAAQADHTPRVARAPSDGPATAPAPGSKTRRVWEIADACLLQHPTVDKVLRKMVADACEKEGVNSSTMSVQYSKWKTTKNI